MKGSVQSQSAVATRQIVARGLADIPDEILTAMPKKQTLVRMVQAERRKINGQQPNPRDRQFRMPPEYQSLVIYDSGEADQQRILVFGQRDLVRHLRDAQLWFVDGTFDAAPDIYAQLYSFHAKVCLLYTSDAADD